MALEDHGPQADLIRLTQEELDVRLRERILGDLSFLDLSDLSLAGADLTGVAIEHSNLAGVDLRKANLRESSITSTNMEGANLQEASLGRAYFYMCDLRSIDVSDANMQEALLDEVDLRGAKLQDANLSGCRILRSNASTSDFERATLETAYLDESAFVEANLSRADLVRASLLGCDLRDADLSTSDLERADLRTADMSGVKLHLASFDRTKVAREAFITPFFEDNKRMLVEASEVYDALRANFESIGRYGDARWAYIRSRRLRRQSYSLRFAWTCYGDAPSTRTLPESKGGHRAFRERIFFHLVYSMRWLGAWAAEIVSGFGELPFRVVLWGAVVVIGFAVLFAFTGSLTVNPQPRGALQYYLGCLLFSLSSFLSTGLVTVHADGLHGDVFSTMEAGLGTAWFGLLLFTLGNRISKS